MFLVLLTSIYIRMIYGVFFSLLLLLYCLEKLKRKLHILKNVKIDF